MVWYFAYGSNLDIDQMMSRVGEWKESRRAELRGYKLTFDIFASDWGCGAADVVVGSEEDAVIGVLYLLDESQMEKLDHYEETPKMYRREKVNVYCDGDLVEAVTYVVVNKEKYVKPSEKYFDTILRGLSQHGYGQDVVDRVKNMSRV